MELLEKAGGQDEIASDCSQPQIRALNPDRESLEAPALRFMESLLFPSNLLAAHEPGCNLLLQLQQKVAERKWRFMESVDLHQQTRIGALNRIGQAFEPAGVPDFLLATRVGVESGVRAGTGDREIAPTGG